MKEYIGQINLKENNQQYLDKKYQDAKNEEKTLPNTLMEMQEIANAPWENGGISREEYIKFVKTQEMQEAKNEKEPSKLNAPKMANAEV